MGAKSTFQPTVNVASRCAVPTSIIPSGKQFFSRSSHVIWDDCPSLQILLANFYGSGGAETTANLNPITYTAALEWPLVTASNTGALTQITFNGQASGVCSVGGTLLSDFVVPAVPIPRGARVRIRVWGSTLGGLPLCGGMNSARSILGGPVDDIYRSSSGTIVDQTMSKLISALTYPLDVRGFKPLAIIAPSRVPSFALVGDSRAQGWLNSNGPDIALDAYGLVGEGERVVGQLGPFINMAFSSDASVNFTAAQSPLRVALLPYVTDIYCQYGINDIFGSTEATINERMRVIKDSVAPGKKLTVNTLSPTTTGAFIAADGSDQTVTAQESVRVAWNELLRSGGSVADSVVEVADICESFRNSGKWKAGARTVTDAVALRGAYTVTSETAAFTVADLNKSIYLLGAGVNGAGICSIIQQVNSSTSITIAAPTWTAASNITANIGDIYTIDGLHGSLQANLAIQAQAHVRGLGYGS